MAYTTVAAIELRLEGWASTQAPQAFGQTQVKPALIEQLISQASARIDACLRDRYSLPLKGTYPELASCAEKLVMCELIGQLYAGQTPSENGGYGALMCSRGEMELKALKDIELTRETQSVIDDAGMTPISGVRSLPSIYTPKKPDPIKPIRW